MKSHALLLALMASTSNGAARALLGCLCYMVVQELMRPYAHRAFADTDCGGTPCWVTSLKLIAQNLVLPGSMAAALHEHGWSIQRWCSHAKVNGLCNSALLCAYVFVAFLVLDLWYAVLFPGIMRMLMVQHHIVCLLGHAYALICCPRLTQPYFLCAITFLELGSSSANFFFLFLGTPYAAHGALIYSVGMTLTHLAALTLTVLWNWSGSTCGLHPLLRWPPMFVWFILIYMRQIEIPKASQKLLR